MVKALGCGPGDSVSTTEVGTKINICMEKYLISYLPKDTEHYFSSTDDKKSFKKNSKNKKHKDWIYKTKPITYKYNSHGFRTRPFEEVNWAESIAVLGCSNVEGVGLAVEDTLCYQLEKILNIPVVNLGIGGSAVDFACWNSLRLHNYYPRPKSVVQIWTSLDRYSDYDKHGYRSYLPRFHGYYYKLNWNKRSEHYIESDRALWKDKTVYYEGSFFGATASRLKIKEFDNLDYARDLCHPGIDSNRIAAKNIAENLVKQGI